MQKIILISLFITSFLLTGCFPVVLTGATASANQFAKDRTAEQTFKDMKIASAIKAAFIKNNFRELYTKISVEVVNCRVLYTGDIAKDEDAINAVQIAWNQEGVTEVLNELKVKKNSGNFNLVQYTRDSLITSQIKSKIFVNRSIKFANYTVITLNDEVYLFGIARSDEELEKVAGIASNVHGVQKVVSHVRVDENADNKKATPKKFDDDSDNGLLIDDQDKDTDNVQSGPSW